jgi:hypothetical protein
MWLFGKQGRWGNTAQRRQRGYRRRNHLSLRGGFLERLEDRRLLAIDVTFAAGILTFTSDGTVVDNQLTINAENDASTTVSFSSPEGINLVGGATNPQALVTAINVNLLAGNDTLTVNGFTGANAIAVNGLMLTFAAVPYAFPDVENLTVNGQGGADTISATGITVTGALSINGGAGADTLSVNSAISTTLDTGSLTVADPDATDDVDVQGTVTTDALAGQDYQTDVTLLGNTTLIAGAGDIDFAQEISGPLFDLQADSSGTTTFNGAVNVGGLSTFGGGQTKFNIADPLVAVTTAGNQIYNNPVLLLQDTILTSSTGSIFFNAAVDAADNVGAGSDFGLTVNTPLGNNFISAELGGDNQDAFAMDSDEHGLEFLFTDATGGVSGQTQINVADPLVAVLTAGNQDYNDPVLLRQDTILTSSAGNIRFDNFVDAADNAAAGSANFGLTVNTPAGNNVFNAEVGGDNQDLLLMTSDVDGLEFLTTDATGAGGQTELNVAAPLVAVTTTNQQRYRDNVLLRADTTLVASDMAADGNDNVIFEGTITAAADNAHFLVVNANDVTRFEGNVGSLGVQLESLTTDLAPFPASGTTEFGRLTSPPDVTVFTTGDQLFNDNVLLRTDTDLIATRGNITFEGFIDAADNGNATTSSFGLSVNTPNTLATPTKGNNFFNDEVGGNNVAGSDPNGLKDLRTDITGIAGQTKFNFPAGPHTVLTTLDQQYLDAVLLMFDTVLTSTTGDIFFNNFVDAADDGLLLSSIIGLTVNTPAGDNEFNQEVGGDNQDALGMASDFDGLEFLITDNTGVAGGETRFNIAAPTFVAVKTAGPQLYQDDVLLEADTTLLAESLLVPGADDVTFEKTVRSSIDGANGLTINATDVTTFQGKVGDNAQRLEFLATNLPGTTRIEINTAVGEISINTLLDQTFNDPVIFDSPTDLTLLCAGTDLNFNNTLGARDPNEENLIIEVGGQVDFDFSVTTPNALNSLIVRGKGALPGKTNIRISLFTVADSMQFDTPVCVDAPGNLTTFRADNDIIFNSTLDGVIADAEAVIVEAGDITRFGDNVGGLARLFGLRTNAPGATEFGRPAAGTAITVNTANEQLYRENAVLNVDTTLVAADAAADGNDSVIFEQTITANGDNDHFLVVNANDVTRFQGDIGTAANRLQSLTTDASPFVVSGRTEFGAAGGAAITIRTGGAQLYRDMPVLNVDTTLFANDGANGDVTFEQAVTANDDNQQFLVINATDVTRFNANVGTAANRLESLTTDQSPFTPSGVTQFGTPAGAAVTVRTAQSQLFRDDVVLNVDTTFIANLAGAASVTFGGKIDGLAADTQRLRVESATFIAFQGDVGTMVRLNDVFADADAGNISLREMRVQDTLAAPEGVIELHAEQGAIVDLNGILALNTFGHSLIATARDGIELDTELTRLIEVRNATDGVNPATLDILIREENTLFVREVVNEARDAILTSKGHTLTVENVAMIENFAKRNFIISVSDLPNAMPNDDVIIAGKIRAEQIVSLIAGDDITLEGTSDVRSDNLFVYMKVDVINVDAVGGTVIMLGILQGNDAIQYPLVAEGDTGDDLFSIQKLPQSAIAILARAGTLDNTFIVLTDAAEDVRVFATIVDLAGQSPGGVNPIEITYVDNEQLDLVTRGGDDKVFVQMPEPTHGILANIVRMTTGAGEDSLKINGSTLNDVIRVNSYTPDPNYRFQVRGDTGETECLQVFGFTGNDIIENAAPIAALLDGGNGQDAITGSDFSIQPATGTEVYDVIFGGGDADSLLDPLIGRRGLSGRAGNDFLYADHDYNLGTPVLTIADGDIVNGGLGMDVIIALGGDSIQRDSGDFESDIVVGQGLGLSINDFLFAQLISPSAANIDQQLQAGLNKHCAMPIP